MFLRVIGFNINQFFLRALTTSDWIRSADLSDQIHFARESLDCSSASESPASPGFLKKKFIIAKNLSKKPPKKPQHRCSMTKATTKPLLLKSF